MAKSPSTEAIRTISRLGNPLSTSPSRSAKAIRAKEDKVVPVSREHMVQTQEGFSKKI